MNFLEPERAVLDRFLPGLDKRLAALPQPERERPGGPALPLFKAAGGPALLVPAEHQGLGISAEDAVSLQRAVGARSPSLAVATTMHHLSVAGLVQAYEVAQGMEWMLLEAVADQRLLVASGFAEGRPGQSILDSSIKAHQDGDDVVLNGAKKPCSLSASMDLLSVSVALDDGRARSSPWPWSPPPPPASPCTRSGAASSWPARRATRSGCGTSAYRRIW